MFQNKILTPQVVSSLDWAKSHAGANVRKNRRKKVDIPTPSIFFEKISFRGRTLDFAYSPFFS